jgi:hypothetical protein
VREIAGHDVRGRTPVSRSGGASGGRSTARHPLRAAAFFIHSGSSSLQVEIFPEAARLSFAEFITRNR